MFRVRALTIVVGVAVAVGSPHLVAAQSTCSLPVAAYLTDPTGAPLDGAIELEVRFYVDGGAEALPVECRSTSASLDGGWLRFLVDVCGPPEPDDCGVVALSSVFESSDAVWVGIRIGDDDEELSPRQLVGSVPYAIHAASADEARIASHAGTADVATSLDGFDPSDYAAVASLSAVATTGAFADLTDVPVGLSDGDDDTLAVLTCADSQPAIFDAGVGGWVCGEAGSLWGLVCADGQGLIYNEEEGAFNCLNIYDKDNDTTPVWEDCDDNDPVLNGLNIDGDQSSSCDGDCNDTDETINPENTELCGTEVDENCDGIMEEATSCLSIYYGADQAIYMMEAEVLPEGDAATWYQEICEAAGLHPVSCDHEVWTPGYDASAFGAVPLNAGHYGCNVSGGIRSLTGWTDILTFHQPYGDDQGVCQNGCSIDGDPVFPICTP
jgi:hypothetical protein